LALIRLAWRDHAAVRHKERTSARIGQSWTVEAWPLAPYRCPQQPPTRPQGLHPLFEEAWSTAERFGAGSAWKALADASARSRPREAAELYRTQIDAKLLHANTRVYPEVARMLVAMRSLSESAGDLNRFEEYLADVRSRYARRSSLMGLCKRSGSRRRLRRPTDLNAGTLTSTS
jgi:hypothetical protein